MKIEVGESIMRSWLRHVEGCQVAELNWKPSLRWPVRETPPLMEAAREHFKEGIEGDIFKGRIVSQVLRQAEIDVFGIKFDADKGTISKIYCVDIAYHRNGLGYVNVAETEKRVLKKLIRHVMIVQSVFGSSLPLQVVFASPKAGKPYVGALEKAMESLRTFFSMHNISCETVLFLNDTFRDSILQPVLQAATDVADTSELFLRSYQLLRMFGSTI